MRRTWLNVYVHFVWSTLRREPIITDEVARRLYRYIEGICLKHDCHVQAVGGMPDHVHLLVSLPATISMAELMEHVKGSSSRFMTKEVLSDKWFKWQEGYGALSVSAADKKLVVEYIANQKQHHQDGKLWDHAERIDPETALTPRQRP